jgi:hypothetical protein
MYKLCTVCVCVCFSKDFYVIYSILLQVCMVAMSIARIGTDFKVIYTCCRVLGSDFNHHSFFLLFIYLFMSKV